MATTQNPINMRFSPKLRARIQEAARRKETSFSAMCRILMVERLDELGITEASALATTPCAEGRTTKDASSSYISDMKRVSVDEIPTKIR